MLAHPWIAAFLDPLVQSFRASLAPQFSCKMLISFCSWPLKFAVFKYFFSSSSWYLRLQKVVHAYICVLKQAVPQIYQVLKERCGERAKVQSFSFDLFCVDQLWRWLRMTQLVMLSSICTSRGCWEHQCVIHTDLIVHPWRMAMLAWLILQVWFSGLLRYFIKSRLNQFLSEDHYWVLCKFVTSGCCSKWHKRIVRVQSCWAPLKLCFLFFPSVMLDVQKNSKGCCPNVGIWGRRRKCESVRDDIESHRCTRQCHRIFRQDDDGRASEWRHTKHFFASRWWFGGWFLWPS